MMRKLADVVAGFVLGLSVAGTAVAAPDDGTAENLFVFVGEKIDLVKTAPPCKGCVSLDLHYAATYRILETVYGQAPGDTIRFNVADHYGVPLLSELGTVLLFVTRKPNGAWGHVKYLFVTVYQTVDGKWVGCGDPYGGKSNPQRTVQARPVEFSPPVSFSLEDMTPEEIAHDYPAGYFDIRDGHAYCRLGTSVGDLFEVKKQTALKTRGIFK